MKIRFLHKFKHRLIVIFTILCAAFIINSCRKDSKTAQQASSPAAISQAKTWYENKYPIIGSAGSKLITQSIGGVSGGTPDLSQIIQPDWQNAAAYARLGSNVIEMPIAAGANFGYDFNNKTANKIYSDKQYNRAYFLLLNNGTGYQAYVMMIMADPAYVNNDLTKLSNNSYRKHDPDFTGMVAYFTPKGQYVSGAAFVNGQLVTAAANNSSSGGQTVQSVNNGASKPVINTATAVTECTDWYADYYLDGEFWFSQFLGTTCSTTGTGGAPPTTGGGSAPPPPCQPAAPVPQSVGHFTIDVAEPPPPGDGGLPPPEPCPVTPPVTVIDTVKDPCAQAMALANSASFKALMTTLNGKTNLNYEDAYTFDIDANGNVTSTPFQGLPNSSSVKLTFGGGPVDGYAHDHYAGDFPTFSGADIQQIYTMMQGGAMKNPATFTASVVTASGTSYIIKISNPSQFAAFGAANLVSGSSQLTDFLNFYGNAEQVNETLYNDDRTTAYELALLTSLQNSGLSVLKGNSNFTSWGTITSTNNTLTLTNCNPN